MPVVPSYPHDIFTDEALAEPHEHYRALRELGPVVRLDAHDVLAIPCYDEARAVLGDAGTFCSGEGVGLNDAFNRVGAGRNLIMTDGELHDRLRGLVAGGLTPRALRSMREAVAQQAVVLVEELVTRASFDAVADLARALPLTVVPDLVGWPEEGRDQLLEWAGATFDLLGPANSRAEQAGPKVQAMLEFAARSAAENAMIPGSLGARLIEAAQRGELEPSQVPPLLVAYIAPSLDTTISAIGSAVYLFASHPEQWAILRSDPSLIPNAFNEVVRIESPIRAFTRVTTVPTRLGGQDVGAGTRLVVLYGSANRDERRFARADEFDITRSNASEHLGFGYGVHGCAGQGLARLESHSVLSALVARVDTIVLDNPVRARNNLISAWASLPVTVTVTS